MPAFTYTALDASGKEKKGSLMGDNAKHIRQQLRSQSLTPLSVTPERRRQSSIKFTSQSISASELRLVTRQLATLLSAGLPLEEALHGVSQQTEQKATRSILLSVREKVREGHSFGDSLAQFPTTFTTLFTATVTAGEQTGRLDAVLLRLADLTEKQRAIKLKVQQALIYPAVMTVVSFGVITFLLTFVIPKIIEVFNESQAVLPLLTRVLLQISAVLRHDGVLILIALSGLIYGVIALLKREEYREKAQRCLLAVPLLSRLLREQQCARFSRTLGILHAAGVPVDRALVVATKVVTLLPLKKALQTATTKIREGAPINQALKQTQYFTPMTVHLIANGERSGELDSMLIAAADEAELALTRVIDTGLRLFEPFLILVMGGIVLFIVLAVLLPLFQLNQLTGALG